MSAILTAVGRQKINSASPLAQVKIKSVAVGSGNSPYNDSILSLQDQKWIGDATHPIKNTDGSMQFSCYIPANVGGWDLIEWGLIDVEGDLIAYGQLDAPINKPIGLMSLTPYFTIILDDSEQLNLVVTDEVNFIHNGTGGRDALDCHPIEAISGLESALNNIDDLIQEKDSQNVKTSGNQTVAGVKTFTSGIKTDYIQSSDNDSVISSSFDGIGLSHKNTGVQIDGLNNKLVFTGSLISDDFSSSKNTNGYQKLPGGLIIQWGTVDYDTQPDEIGVTVTFPISFPNACLNMTGTRKVSIAGQNNDGDVCIISTTRTQANVVLTIINSDAISELRGFTWMAIGY